MTPRERLVKLHSEVAPDMQLDWDGLSLFDVTILLADLEAVKEQQQESHCFFTPAMAEADFEIAVQDLANSEVEELHRREKARGAHVSNVTLVKSEESLACLDSAVDNRIRLAGLMQSLRDPMWCPTKSKFLKRGQQLAHGLVASYSKLERKFLTANALSAKDELKALLKATFGVERERVYALLETLLLRVANTLAHSPHMPQLTDDQTVKGLERLQRSRPRITVEVVLEKHQDSQNRKDRMQGKPVTFPTRKSVQTSWELPSKDVRDSESLTVQVRRFNDFVKEVKEKVVDQDPVGIDQLVTELYARRKEVKLQARRARDWVAEETKRLKQSDPSLPDKEAWKLAWERHDRKFMASPSSNESA
jgi:hypothetical protein